MPMFQLKIKADLENIQQMVPLNDNVWKFDIASTGGDTKEGITVSKADVIPLDGSRGEANFVMKWPGEQNQSYIKIVDNIKGVISGTRSYTEDDSGKWVTILALECRGLEIVRWCPGEDFVATGLDGAVFEQVDLNEGEWAEYDEETDLAVSITNLESTIERA